MRSRFLRLLKWSASGMSAHAASTSRVLQAAQGDTHIDGSSDLPQDEDVSIKCKLLLPQLEDLGRTSAEATQEDVTREKSHEVRTMRSAVSAMAV